MTEAEFNLWQGSGNIDYSPEQRKAMNNDIIQLRKGAPLSAEAYKNIVTGELDYLIQNLEDDLAGGVNITRESDKLLGHDLVAIRTILENILIRKTQA